MVHGNGDPLWAAQNGGSMKSFLKLFAFVGCVGLATAGAGGCTNHHYSKPGFSVSAPVQARVKANLEIGQEVEGKGEVTRILWFIVLPFSAEYADGVSYGAGLTQQSGGLGALLLGGSPSDDDMAKGIAAYQALKSDYDVILGARYHVVIDDFGIFKGTTATVKGWGAKVKSVEQIAPQN